MLPIIALASAIGSGVGLVVWRLWLEDRVRSVVREEVADVRITVAAVAAGLGLPDSAQVRVRERYRFGPSPRP